MKKIEIKSKIVLTLEFNSSIVFISKERRATIVSISVKMARVGANLTQQQMADEMGIHVQTYAKMENNPGSMSIDDAKLFSRIVGVPWTEIFFDDNSN
jgi:DNA-binding XRE family transcriptional regulator